LSVVRSYPVGLTVATGTDGRAFFLGGKSVINGWLRWITGYNGFGQLGAATTTNRAVPGLMTGFSSGVFTNVRDQIAVRVLVASR
jgi:hypothetical protein